MSLSLDAGDVFKMAVRIETQAAEFFAALARSVESPVIRKTLLELAGMEADHEKTFQGMAELAAKGKPPLGKQAQRYARMVAMMGVDVLGELSQSFTGGESVEQVLAEAIEFEKTTIVFFLGMREMVADKVERAHIDAIIKEELGHILKLSGYFVPALGRLPSTPAQAPRSPLHGQADVH